VGFHGEERVISLIDSRIDFLTDHPASD